MIELVQYEEKRYRRNNPRRWCAREVAVDAVQVRVGWGRSCPSAWLDHTHGWSLCGLLPADCVQGVRQGVC